MTTVLGIAKENLGQSAVCVVALAGRGWFMRLLKCLKLVRPSARASVRPFLLVWWLMEFYKCFRSSIARPLLRPSVCPSVRPFGRSFVHPSACSLILPSSRPFVPPPQNVNCKKLVQIKESCVSKRKTFVLALQKLLKIVSKGPTICIKNSDTNL